MEILKSQLFTAKELFLKYEDECINLGLTSRHIGFWASSKAVRGCKISQGVNWLIYEKSFLLQLEKIKNEPTYIVLR